MISPIEEHKKLLGVRNIRNVASEVLFEKYIIKNSLGSEKREFLEDTDQERLILSRNGGYPIPGLVYTFIYKPSPDEIKIAMDGKRPVKYVDHVPIIFCLDTRKESYGGINLNILPPEERLKFLQLYYVSYENFFSDIERRIQNDVIAINKKFIEDIGNGSGKRLIDRWSALTKSNFSSAYRKYTIDKVDRLRMIEYPEWKYIPFLEPTDSFKLATAKLIHDSYRRNSL